MIGISKSFSCNEVVFGKRGMPAGQSTIAFFTLAEKQRCISFSCNVVIYFNSFTNAVLLVIFGDYLDHVSQILVELLSKVYTHFCIVGRKIFVDLLNSLIINGKFVFWLVIFKSEGCYFFI